jgi:broad specificity phosphatase PhoE
MRWLLVPHAETDGNVRGVYLGWSSAGINERGRRQAAAVARRLQHEPIAAGHVSDLCRARQTAAIIAEGRPFAVHEDARLRERHFGAWEGLSADEVRGMHPEGLPETPPGGEDVAQVAARLHGFCRHIQERGYAADDTLLLVAHRGSLRVLLCLLLGLAPERHWQFFLAQASVSEVYLGPRGCVLTGLNDTHHLEGI